MKKSPEFENFKLSSAGDLSASAHLLSAEKIFTLLSNSYSNISFCFCQAKLVRKFSLVNFNTGAHCRCNCAALDVLTFSS